MQYLQASPEPKMQEPRDYTRMESSEDEEVLAYFEAQRKEARSREWAACLDAMIRNLRK